MTTSFPSLSWRQPDQGLKEFSTLYEQSQLQQQQQQLQQPKEELPKDEK